MDSANSIIMERTSLFGISTMCSNGSLVSGEVFLRESQLAMAALS